MTILDRSDDERRARSAEDVVAVVLAAGRGERFTAGTKQLATVAGRTLVANAVATAHAAGVDRVMVVVGHDGDAVAAAVRSEDPLARIVSNPDHAEGQSTSFVAGIRAAAGDERVRLAVVLLGDQPGVAAETVRAVVAAVRGGSPVARAHYADGPGHPIAFARELFEQLTDVQGDVGARHLLDDLGVTHVLAAGTVPLDVDTVEDLATVRATLE